jgi:predicted nuclease of restriction endonuclease-like (RecB) superfamily
MAKKSDKLPTATNKAAAAIIDKELFENVRSVLNSARGKAFAAVNFAMVEAYWNVGRLIVEKQGGDERAAYGDGLIDGLSTLLTAEYGKGFDKGNLRNMRQFYTLFSNHYALRSELTWTHYRLIMRVENPRAREFYLNECTKGIWSTRQLERQINSFCYERLLASRDKDGIVEEIINKEQGVTPLDTVKDPFVLEFLGLDPNVKYLESELEQSLIEHIQKFLLELGRGFAFESRQKRITFDGRHFYIDLVFYNYILKCFVLVDLKTSDLTHQDIGQMQMYVNYYTRELMNDGDNPPIGIILCADKSENIVKYTFPDGGNPQIFTSKYKLYLPTEEELMRELAAEKELIMREKALRESKKNK